MINNGKNKGKGIGLVMRSRILSSLLVLGCAVPVAAPVLQPLSVYAEETAGTPSETDPAAPAEDQAATTEITVQVVFAGTETFPEKITLNLLANNVVCNTVEVTAETQWAFTFKNLPVTDEAGAPIVYTVDEVEPAGFVKTIDGTTITNTWSEQKAAEDAAALQRRPRKTPLPPRRPRKTPLLQRRPRKTLPPPRRLRKTPLPPRRPRKTPLPPRRLRKTPPLPRRLRKTLPPQRRLRKTPPLPRRLRKTLPLPRRLQKMHRKLPQMLLPRKKPQKTLLQRRLQKTQKRSKRQMLLQRRLQTRLPLQRKKRKKPKRSPKMPGKLLKKPSWRLKKQGSLPRRPVTMPIN